MENARRIEEIVRQLDKQKEAYLETVQKAHDLLAGSLAASASLDLSRLPRTSSGLGLAPVKDSSSNSKSTGEESDDDEDEALYVQTPLEWQCFTEEEMRSHLKSHKFDDYGKQVLDGVAGNHLRLAQSPLLPSRKGPFDDRSHYSHSQIFDVGPDGCPLLNDQSITEKDHGRGMALWHAVKDLNPPSRQRRAVGRITVVREPSPILFGAMHYILNNTFDADELFRSLVDAELSSAMMHRSFDEDERRQRSFIFNLEYFTLIGTDCQPMKWQLCAGQEDRKPGYIQITRCSSVVALTLNGPPIKELKNPARRRRSARGYVYDPFASWQVVNIQCYADWKASLDVHDSTKHYVNGPEAFMNHLLSEFRDAQRRYNDITKKISRRIRPPLEFMFDAGVRHTLLFEDHEYNIIKRYFWTHQTLAMVNESIKAMIDSFEYTFTDEVWEGRHKTLWPLLDEDSPRNEYYRKVMRKLRAAFEIEITNLRRLMDENSDRQREIIVLREALFAGTSIEESRKSVEATETTVQQGHNIKLLTLVNIFFLPLTFVTSVFGMEAMPNAQGKIRYEPFAIATVTICIPFLLLIGSLNTHKGMNFWRKRTRAVVNSVVHFFSWVAKGGEKRAQLTPTKSFDSQTTNGSIRRWSTDQKGARNPETEGPVTRESQPRRPEDRLTTSVTFGPDTRPTTTERNSRLAEMWIDERMTGRRKSRYSEEV